MTNSLTPANGASLFVLAFFLFGCFMGAVAIPAALGMLSSITTPYLASLLVAGLAWGLGLGRLTLSLTKFGFSLAIGAALLVALLFVLNFVFTFLNGGKDLFWDRAVHTVQDVTSTVYNYDRAPKGSWFFTYEAHRKQNICALYEAIRTKGDIAATRRECDPAAWASDQKLQQQQDHTAFDSALKEHAAAMDKLTQGMQRVAVAPFSTSAIGMWAARTQCNGQEFTVNLLVEGEASRLHGVLLMYEFRGKASDIAHYTAYAFSGAQTGNALDIEPGDWIQEGTMGKRMAHHFKLNSGKNPALVEASTPDGCLPLTLFGTHAKS